MMNSYKNEIHGLPLDFQYDNLSYGEFLFNQSEKFPNNVCHIDAETGRTETYREVQRKCIRIAIKMQELNITSNDFIVTCSFNSMNSSLPIYAAQYLGAKVASIDPTLSVNDKCHLLGLVQPKMIFFCIDSVKFIEKIVENLNEKPLLIIFDTNNKDYISFDTFLNRNENEDAFKPNKIKDVNEMAFVYFSSGTTGLPKGIKISHRAMLYTCDAIRNMNFTFDCCMHFTTFYWISALMLTTYCFMVGGRRVICRNANVENMIKLCSDFKVTTAFAASSYAYSLKEDSSKYDLSPELAIFLAGAKLQYNVLQKIKRWLPNTYVEITYGMTEVSGFLTLFDRVRDRNIRINGDWGCSGKPIPGIKMRIADLETGRSLGPNEKGEIRIKSPSCTQGYYNEPNADIYDEDGWLRSGDVGYYDENYCFYVIDRIKEMFKYKNWHVLPAILERVILKHPAVRECVVFGTPHETDGDLPTAALILNKNNNNIKEDDIITFANEQLDDRQKLRGGIKFLNDFPRTPSGKVIKQQIKKLFNNL